MPTAVRAAVLREVGQPLTIEQLVLADPGPGQVRIRVRAAGLCHSDLHFMDGNAGHWKPVVLGHESVGEIVELGEGVDDLEVGDTVVPYLIPHCGDCYLCTSGRTNLCVTWNLDQTSPTPSPFSTQDGGHVGALLGIGGFAEQVVVNATQVVRVDPTVDQVVASCLACGVTTGLGSALIAADVRPGSRVAVFGLGGVGLGAVQGARLAGATSIVGIDTNPAKETVARQVGATHFLTLDAATLVEDIHAITSTGVDYSFDCVGHPQVLRDAMRVLDRRLGGVATLVGILPSDSVVELTPGDLFGVTLVRTSMGGAQKADVARFVDWFAEGRILLDDIVSHRLALDEITEGFELMRQGRVVRAVVDFGPA